jgi:predicted TPR repeat methyltransferase
MRPLVTVWLLVAGAALLGGRPHTPRKQPSTAALALRTADAAAERGDWDGAVASYRLAVQLAPEDEAAQNGLAEAECRVLSRRGHQLEVAGQTEAAMRSYRTCLLLNPGDADAAAAVLRNEANLAKAVPPPDAFADVPMLLNSGNWLQLHHLLAKTQAPPTTAVVSALLEADHGHFAAATRLLDSGRNDLALRYIATRRRWWYAERWALPLGIAYLGCLLGFTFVGLRREARA